MIKKYQSDQATDILFRTESDAKWITYNPLHISNYTRVHFDPASDMMVMCVNTETNSFTRVTQLKWLRDKIALSNAVLDEHVWTQAPNGASRAVGTHHGPTRIHAPTGAYAIGGTAKLAHRYSIISATAAARTLPPG